MTKCELCGKEFMRHSPTQKFCCKECCEEFKSRQRPPGKRRFSGRSYKNSEQRLNELREKYKNGITAEILREFAENLQIPRVQREEINNHEVHRNIPIEENA